MFNFNTRPITFSISALEDSFLELIEVGVSYALIPLPGAKLQESYLATLPDEKARVDGELVTIWDEWDTNTDGKYDTHTINSRSAPSYVPLTAKVGDRVRMILANIGFEFHTPHLHGQKWVEVNVENPQLPGWGNPNGVLTIGPAEIKVVEFTVRHAGTWLFHCHVVPHVADDGKYPQGMLTLLQVTMEEGVISSQPIIQKEVNAGGTDVSQRTQVASIPDFQAPDFPPGQADQGYDVYNKNGKSCHGDSARGEYGPKLQQNPILHDDSNFWKTVLKGRGNMPAWEERLGIQQIADVQAYLKTLKETPPPWPHLR